MADLTELARTHLADALADERGRSAELILRDGPLRQSVIALRSGIELAEHNSPDAASLQVLVGRVRVTGQPASVPSQPVDVTGQAVNATDQPGSATGQEVIEVAAGRLDLLTHHRHAVLALEDSVLLLTTVTGIGETGGPERAR